MTLIFFDKLRETPLKIDNVIIITEEYAKINGRLTKCWHITQQGGKCTSYKQKDFSIASVRVI